MINLLGQKQTHWCRSVAQVYKGRYLKKLVAIKILTDNSEEEQAAFVRETLLLRDLRHPHVVQYLGHMQLDGKVGISLKNRRNRGFTSRVQDLGFPNPSIPKFLQ